jgi:hypothetical protein
MILLDEDGKIKREDSRIRQLRKPANVVLKIVGV